MLNRVCKSIIVTLIGLAGLTGSAQKLSAQTYQIDCAILLCLSGGWPASAPCARARAEFIRRITPWPVEPPLQIWRCPMGASYHPDRNQSVLPRIYKASFKTRGLHDQRMLASTPINGLVPIQSVFRQSLEPSNSSPAGLALRLIQDRADIDISGPDFNFVRSIRVYDVRYAQQHEAGRDDDDCRRSAYVLLGTYGTQGDFSWNISSAEALPAAHTGLERWGEDCPSIFHRSVFVDWRDYLGNYGFEQVDY